eukprot:Clim_evm5s146 gene=Clim_evmTU5s146
MESINVGHIILALGGFLTAWIWILAIPDTPTLFQWHPMLMTVGLFVLAPLGFQMMWINHLQKGKNHDDRVQMHFGVMAIGVVAAIWGFGAIYLNKKINDAPHFTSNHGAFGQIVVIAFMFQTTAALPVLGGDVMPAVVKNNMQVLYKFHKLMGRLIYLGGLVSFFLAYQSLWILARVRSDNQWYALNALTAIFGALVMLSPWLQPKYVVKKKTTKAQ